MICLEYLEVNGEVVLVFGCEYVGLINEELQCCQFYVYIFFDFEFGLLNLVVVVQVFIYEVCMVWLVVQGKLIKMEKFEFISMFNIELVMVDELEFYYVYLERMLIDIGFFDLEKLCYLMLWLWCLYGCSVISKLEMNILCGILIEIQKVV